MKRRLLVGLFGLLLTGSFAFAQVVVRIGPPPPPRVERRMPPPSPGTCGSQAITTGMAECMSGCLVTGLCRLKRGPSGSRRTGSIAAADGF
jgi:hypothetical protein